MTQKEGVIIVAGGSGTRMGSQTPKQFLPLNGRPILMHTIEKFYAYSSSMDIVVVLPEEHFPLWKQLCSGSQFSIPHKVVAGGKERFYSVKNGLAAIDKSVTIIGIHDGVRPNISVEKIAQIYAAAREKGSAIPVVPVVDSLRRLSGDDSEPVNRSEFKAVQTPQCFDIELITRAYQQPYMPLFTDDATVVEALGEKVSLVDGEPDNIKITYPRDITLIENVIKR